MWTANLKNLIAACILSLEIICTASGDVIFVNPGEYIQAAIVCSTATAKTIYVDEDATLGGNRRRTLLTPC